MVSTRFKYIQCQSHESERAEKKTKNEGKKYRSESKKPWLANSQRKTEEDTKEKQ